MKRAMPVKASKPAKKARTARPAEPEYCDAETQRDDNGKTIWPASAEALDDARAFLRECAAAKRKTLIVPDKDADGLSSGVIIQRTLEHLGLPRDYIDVHILAKHATVHDDAERRAMRRKRPGYVIVVDQGSRGAPPVVASASDGDIDSDSKGDGKCDSEGEVKEKEEEVKALVVDHHYSDDFPSGATVASACHFPPVATSSLLTYEICRPLFTSEEAFDENCSLPCVIGTHGDLGTTLKWRPPFPDMDAVFKRYTKAAVNKAVGLLNAPRRTAQYNVHSAWTALLSATTPKDILDNTALLEARQKINEEVEFRSHTPPKFSKDGKFAVLRISSDAQIHGVIATRWAYVLKSKLLEIIVVANSGYREGYVNFSCRVAGCARSKDPPVNIIEALRDVAARDESGTLVQRMGESFARGHKEASGGIIPAAEFDELMQIMRVGEKPDPVGGEKTSSVTKGAKSSPQKNNLHNYFGKQ